MKRHIGFLVAMVALILMVAAPGAWAAKKKEVVSFEDALIRFEFNSTDQDLGIQIFVDGGPWTELKIVGPDRRKILEVEIGGKLKKFGWKELFGESEEPNFADMPPEEILALFPEGEYKFSGKGVDGEKLVATALLTHNIPDGPASLVAKLEGNSLVISWVAPPPVSSLTGLDVNIVAYQVIVGDFQVTVPASITSVTVTPEFVGSLASGDHEVEVLAIEEGGNQTISLIFFTKP
jgi:hypothetical protein